MEARMLQDLQVQKHERALEIGTGSGYMAALLAHQAHSVLSLECVAELADSAAARLHQMGIHNAEVRQADGSKALRDTGRFHAIVLSGSVPAVPQHLLDLLEIGGRLMAIVGDEPIMSAQLFTRVSESAFSSTTPWDANAPRLHGFTEHSQFHF
jgi:protein-L-isoaspartate(D-aspartate) O-methyltransferase